MVTIYMQSAGWRTRYHQTVSGLSVAGLVPCKQTFKVVIAPVGAPPVGLVDSTHKGDTTLIIV